jgi:hypothetical protein
MLYQQTLSYLFDRALHSTGDTRAPVRAKANTRNQDDRT